MTAPMALCLGTGLIAGLALGIAATLAWIRDAKELP